MDGGSRVRARTSSLPPAAGDDPAAEFAHRVESLSLSRPQEEQAEAAMAKEWTNEKHRMYLKSMEATFVDQLYGYIDPKLSRQQQQCETLTTPSGQFKVLRRGCWQKVDFQMPGVAAAAAARVSARRDARAHGLLRSPWIQHFRHVKKPQQQADDLDLALQQQQQQPKSSRRNHSSSNRHDHNNSSSSNNNYTEMSDQNFVDEDMEEVEEEEGGKGGSSTCSSKRIKVVVVTDSAPHSDQVVPFGSSATAAVKMVDRKRAHGSR